MASIWSFIAGPTPFGAVRHGPRRAAPKRGTRRGSKGGGAAGTAPDDATTGGLARSANGDRRWCKTRPLAKRLILVAETERDARALCPRSAANKSESRIGTAVFRFDAGLPSISRSMTHAHRSDFRLRRRRRRTSCEKEPNTRPEESERERERERERETSAV